MIYEETVQSYTKEDRSWKIWPKGEKRKLIWAIIVGTIISFFWFGAPFLFAVEPDFTGSFTFEFRAPINRVLYGHNVPADFADISADLDFTVDENNLVHTSIKGLSGGNVTFGDAYLQTAWGFMTTKLGNISYDSAGYGVSNKDYESQTKGLSGAGFTFEAPLGKLTLAGGKHFDVFPTPDAWGIGLKYSEGIIESLGVSYFLTSSNKKNTSALTLSGKVVSGDISAGAGLKLDDGVFSYGVGVKANLSPTWIAVGAGVSEGDLKIGADTGIAYDDWGIDLIISHVEKIDAVTVDAWKKIGAVTLKAGYDYKADADDEVFAKVTASF